MNRRDNAQKLTPEHLARKAVVYLRRSSMAQVKHNQESQRLQYALADTAKAYGFQHVEVIDCDLGMSAATGAQAREGFKRVLASVALGEVGMVLSRELSRLSRTDKDWCQLIELCQIFNTLIADAENLYDLNRLDDQLVLGIKGTLSVVELKTLKFRLQQGREAKAKRGELGRCLAPGYVADPAGQIVKDPNLRVQEAIALVFKKFRELGSIRQTHRWFHEETIELPVNKALGGQFQLAWQLPTVSFLSDVLHNPLYAGAYVYGRRPTEVVVKQGQAVKRQRSAQPAEEASVFIQDHHRGYISWAQYQRNQDIMRSNGGNFSQDESALAVRSGQGLLTGLLRCGRCGRKLHIRYWGKSGTAARYVCAGDFATGGEYCLGFGGATVDQRLSAEILKALSPCGLNASIVAIERLSQQGSDQRAALQRQIQQVEYEAQRAFEQYNQVDPANRLVAEVLEHRWNEKFETLQRLKDEMDAHRDTTVSLSPAETEAIVSLGSDFAPVWTAERQSNTLILVHRQPLLDQWVTQLALFLGLEPRDIGQIGGGKHKPNGQLDVAMIQSLVRKDNVDDLVANYGHVIVDECHHLPAVSFERVLAEVRAKFITGLTATPQRRDGHHPIIEMQLGPVRFSVDARNQAVQSPFIHKLIIRNTEPSFDDSGDLRIQDLYRRLATDEQRNNMIFDDVLHALEAGRSPILLTERKEHLEYFADRLRNFTRNLVVLQGGRGSKKRRDDLNRLAAIPDNEERLVLATGRYIGEGFDDARLDTLFLALPVSWKGTLIQYAGRLHRLHPDKTEVHIYDYVDRNIPMLARMFERRLRGYRAIGYGAEENETNL